MFWFVRDRALIQPVFVEHITCFFMMESRQPPVCSNQFTSTKSCLFGDSPCFETGPSCIPYVLAFLRTSILETITLCKVFVMPVCFWFRLLHQIIAISLACMNAQIGTSACIPRHPSVRLLETNNLSIFQTQCLSQGPLCHLVPILNKRGLPPSPQGPFLSRFTPCTISCGAGVCDVRSRPARTQVAGGR